MTNEAKQVRDERFARLLLETITVISRTSADGGVSRDDMRRVLASEIAGLGYYREAIFEHGLRLLVQRNECDIRVMWRGEGKARRGERCFVLTPSLT